MPLIAIPEVCIMSSEDTEQKVNDDLEHDPIGLDEGNIVIVSSQTKKVHCFTNICHTSLLLYYIILTYYLLLISTYF